MAATTEDFFVSDEKNVINTKYYHDANHGFAHLGFEITFETSDIMPEFDGGYITMMGQNSSDKWNNVYTPIGMPNSQKNIDDAKKLIGSYRESERPHLQICEELTAMGYWVSLIHNGRAIDWQIAKYYTVLK